MTYKVIEIDPVSRISGLLSIRVSIMNGRIENARCGGMQIRGFEHMLQNRPPLDTIYLTARTCGICSCAHSTCASQALEMALGVTPDPNGQMLRDLALGFETLQNHIRQIYQFLIPDYVDLTGISPLFKSGSEKSKDYRLPEELNRKLAAHYMDAITYARSAHKAEAVLTGKAPHAHGIFVGGITTNYDIGMYTMIKPILQEIREFVLHTMEEDIYTIGQYYPEYLQWGKSAGNFMSYGVFADLNEHLAAAEPGVVTQGKKEALDIHEIRESLAYSWLTSSEEKIKALHDPFALDYKKTGAYSWVDAPRYHENAYEMGPLADLIVNGLYKKGTAALHRIEARYLMTRRIIDVMEQIIEEAVFQEAYQEEWVVPESGEGYAFIGAPRGGLLHWLTIENSKVKNYSLLPPSTWNMSPRDENSLPGPVEEALMGTPIPEIEQAETIVGRIVRSFDPCLNCAAHVVSDRKSPFDFRIV